MTAKPIRQPGPDHPIRIEQNPARVTVAVDGQVIADTSNALTPWESNYPPVQYIPLSEVDTGQLQRTDHYTYCPYKGDCCYYTVMAGGPRTVNAVWTYDEPFEAVAAIKGHVAFYPAGWKSPRRFLPSDRGPAAPPAQPGGTPGEGPLAGQRTLRSARVWSARRAKSASAG